MKRSVRRITLRAGFGAVLAALALVLVLAACDLGGRPASATPAAPTAAPAPTFPPTPSPSPQVRPGLVVFEHQGSLYGYDGRASSVLVSDGQAYGPLLSPDGRYLLFRRHEQPTTAAAQPFSLWLLDLSTGAETAVDLAALPPFPFRFEGQVLALPRWPQAVVWLPAGSAFLFNTWVDYSMVGPGAAPSDDLWQGDAATGRVRNLFPETAPPASFTLSPDGRRVLVNRPTRIEAVDLAGGQRRTLLEFPAVATYSEYAWLPEPRWSPDSRVVHVAIAPPDPMQSGTFSLWQLDVEKGTAQRLGEVNGSVFAWSPSGRSWSPDGTRLAYVVPSISEYGVMLADADGTGAALVFVRGAGVVLLGWSPDGETLMVQDGTELYGLAAGPQVQEHALADVGSAQAELLWLQDRLLVHTGDGRLLQVALDGSGVEQVGP